MDNKKNVLILMIVLLGLLVGAGVLYKVLGRNMEKNDIVIKENTAENTAENSQEVYKAPDFTVINQKNEEVKLSDYLGKPIVVNFWASWCGPCKSEMETFENAYLTNKDDVQFMMVNMTDGKRETVETATNYIELEEFTFPVFYDIHEEAAVHYQVFSIPMSFFIDENGNIEGYMTGPMDEDTLKRGIDLINKESTVN